MNTPLNSRILLLFIVGCLVQFYPQKCSAKDLVTDSLALSKDRVAGAKVDGTPAETGGGAWSCFGDIVFDATGGVTPGTTGGACMAILPLPANSKAITISADVKSDGKGSVILALLPNNDPAQFWKTVALWTFLRPVGNWGVLSNGTTLLAQGTPAASNFQFKEKDFNHIELLYEPGTKSVTLTINGEIVVAGKALKDPLPTVTAAAIRFAEPVTEKTSVVKNFSVKEAD